MIRAEQAYIFGRKYGVQLLENMVAGYPFINNSDDVVNGYNGVDTNVTHSLSGAYFNGTTSKVLIDNDLELSPTDGAGTDVAMSWSGWFNIDDLTTNRSLFASRSNNTTGAEFYCFVSPTGYIRFNLYNAGTRSPLVYIGFDTAAGVITAGSNYHVVITYSGSESYTGFNIYINGSPISITHTYSGGYTGSSHVSTYFNFGTLLTASNSWYKGYIKDFYIWKNRVLSVSDVLELYNSGNGNTYPF